MTKAHVQVVLDGDTIPKDLEAALRRVGVTASFGPLSEALRTGFKPTADALVVVADADSRTSSHRLQELLDRVATQPRGTLVLEANACRKHRPAYPPTGPISFGDQTNSEELAARIETIIAMRPTLEALRRGSRANTHADEKLADQYRQQLRLASQMHRELMLSVLPRVDGMALSVLYRPADYVSGDFYDIRRLDDDHVAFSLVDTQGHGICAALLSVFIKRILREQAPHTGRRRPCRPDEVLTRLNDELLEAELTEPHFAAAVYALLNVRTRRIELARGGAPYPILRRADGRAELRRPAGPVIGVVSNACYAVESFELRAGDSLLLYSDGLEPLTSSAEGERSTGLTQVPPDQAVAGTGWYRRMCREGLEPAIEQLKQRHDTLRRLGRPLDDLTVLAVTVAT